MSSQGDPLTHAELQKLDDGVYISEVRKAQAGAVVRTRETADKSWKIAAAVAAVVLAAGFTDRLGEAEPWVQTVGALAIVLWMFVTGLFLWVNHNPPADDPVWAGTRSSVRATMASEISEAQGDRVREREAYAKVQNRTALKFVARRVRIATGWASVALAATAVALIASAVTSGEDTRVGTLLLTTEGTNAIVQACPHLDVGTLPDATAEMDVSRLGTDAPARVTFEPGVCDTLRMHLFLDGELIRGLVDP